MKNVIYDRDFDLGDAEVVNVSTNENILYESYKLSAYQIDLIKKCAQNINRPKTLIKIRKLIRKFPKVPHFEDLLFVHIIGANKNIEIDGKFVRMARKFYHKFPNYFFAKLYISRVYLYTKEYDEISNLYGETLKLSTAFPNRKVFYVNEMNQFLYFSISYFIARGNIEEAQKRLYQMSLIPSSSLYTNAEKDIKHYLNRVDNKVSENQIDEKDFNLGDGEIVKVVTNEAVIFEPYNLSTYQIGLIKKYRQNLENPKTLIEVKKCIKKFPKVPHFEELLVKCVLISGKKKGNEESYERAVRKFYLKFPDFFFAKLHIARVYLLYEEYSEISNLYGETLKLSTAFPNRKVFNINEINQFLYFSISYFIAKGRIENAQERLDQMFYITGLSGMYKNAQNMIRQYIDNLNIEKEEAMIITTDFEEILAEYKFSSKVEKLIIKLNNEFETNCENNSNLLIQAQIASNKYSKIPHFKCIIAECYMVNNDFENAAIAIQELYNSHPDFLYSKLFISELLLHSQDKEDGIQQIFKIFNAELKLSASMQKKYTAKEFIRFQFLAGRVWLYKKRPDLAQECLYDLSRLDTDRNEYKFLQKLISEYYTKNNDNLN